MQMIHIVLCAAVCIGVVSGQVCPSHWYGYSSTSKCYRFVASTPLAWDDARTFCQAHGGDIVRIDTLQERNWIFNELRNIANRTHRQRTWWTGLTTDQFNTQWHWADGSSQGGFIAWASGAPHNAGNHRCAKIQNSNKFNDDDCTRSMPFLCYRDRNVPLKCNADAGWQSLNGACYRVINSKRSWQQAKSACDRNAGGLATVGSDTMETVLHDFAINSHQPVWLGLQAQVAPNTPANWTWWNGTALTTNYWHGQPNVNRGHCVVVSNSLPAMHAWNTVNCTQRYAYVCQKPEGVCQPGWIGHRTQCYQFNEHFRRNFGAANSFCRQQGGQLLKITKNTEQQFINTYLSILKESGVTSIWIGASDSNRDTGPFKWTDGTNVTYKNWAGSTHVPANRPGTKDCAYINTGNANGQWLTTSSCQANKAFVCRIPMDRPVQPLQTTPRPVYSCPANWKQRGSNCFKVMTQPADWSHARANCQQTPGGDLAKIDSANLQGFINGFVQHNLQYWIGLNDRTTEGTYVWNSDTSQTAYKNWRGGHPAATQHQANCVVLEQNQWHDAFCNQQKQYICERTSDSVIVSTPPTTPATDWSLKCGPGWQSNPLTANCYMFIDEPLSWLDALTECRVYHGNLLAIESSQEQNYIAGRIQSMNSIALWTGANDRGTEGGWKWTSGKPFAFLNWAPDQPSSANGNGTDCVAMFTQNALWDDVNCNVRNGYVCEKLGRVRRTTQPPTPTVHIPAGMKLGCGMGWLPWQTNCYKIIRQPATWSQAQDMCGRQTGKLASILSRNENNFIQGNLPNPKLSWDGFWIGMNDITVESTFQWSDGSAVTYTHWNAHEPNNFGSRNEDCVEMRLSTGGWNDEKCTAVRPGYICKTPKHAVAATQAPYQVGCSQVNQWARGRGPYCYQVYNGRPLTFSDATAYCARQFNGTLAVVNDRITQAFIASNLVWQVANYWIGLSDTNTPGVYKWVDNQGILYTNWYSTHTGNERSTCVAMRAASPTGLWENKNCTSTQRFICQFPRLGHYTLPPQLMSTAISNLPCPTGWTANGGHCIKGFTQRYTWMEAQSYCQSIGGDLPSFHQSENDDVLKTLPNNIKNAALWIGFNDRDNENGHVWSDGSAVDYTNWDNSQPDDYYHSQDCVNWRQGSWDDLNCYVSHPFLCSIPRGTSVQPTTAPPTAIASTSQCGSDSRWFYYNNNCYRLSDASGNNQSMTWYDAQAYCNNIQANLASVHTMDENNVIMSYVTKRRWREVWVGLNSLGNNGYNWVDGSPVDFDFYARGQPDDYYGAEKCVQMINGGFWNDMHCAYKQPFVCKKPSSGAAAIVSPTPYPVGGCANGFQRAPGGRNKCFYIGGKLAAQRRNYTDAYAYCRRLGSGYDIASIEDMFELQYVTSMTGGYRNSMWIGLNDRFTNNRFVWQDQTPVFFTNWDRGEPTSQQRDGNRKNIENCVVMRMYKGHEGRWADNDCSQKMGFVCQAKQDPNIIVNTPANTCTKAGYMPYKNGCYKASSPSDRKNWNAAQAVCKVDGGNLVSIKDAFESAFVGNLVHRNYSYWIGLSDTQVQGLYAWVDGRSVTYTNWGWREPSYGQSNSGCVFANRFGRWNDTSCTQTHQYVCKIAGSPPPTTPMPQGTCADPSWFANGEYCYMVSVNTGKSWPEANYMCEHAGMQLASIHTKQEMNFVMHLIASAKVTNPQFRPRIWLGMTQGGTQGAYTWTDGSSVNYVSWAMGQPTKLGDNGHVEECVEFDQSTGKWDDVDCFTNRGYVCKTMKIMSTVIPTDSQGQPLATLPHNDNVPTYKVSNGPIGGVTGRGVSQLPVITENNIHSIGGKDRQTGDNTNIKTNTSTLGLSNGGIAGVVIACLLIIILLAVGVVYLKQRGVIKPPPLITSQHEGSLGFDNALYNKDTEKVKIDSDA